MVDKFNTIENLEKEFFQDDTDISALVNYFHTKLKTDLSQYDKHNLPALACHAYGYREDEPHYPYVETLVEVVNRGGDWESVDGAVKEIVSLAIDKLKKEDPARMGQGFGNQVQHIQVTGAVIDYMESQGVFTVRGGINVSVGIVE